MRFVWFWTFWHWSKEGHRSGAMLRSPLLGIAGHWDEWYRHEASPDDRARIEDIDRTPRGQSEFLAWLRHHWAREAISFDNPFVVTFVLRQLSQVPPFTDWPVLDRYREGYGVHGIHAIVLAEESSGEADDVRRVEVAALPAEIDRSFPPIVPEGFQAGDAELETPRRAAMSLLCGRGLATLLALWIAGGRRPYPRPVRTALDLSWLAVGGLVVYLLTGPDPDRSLPHVCLALAMLWAGLVGVSIAVLGNQSLRAWNCGRELRARVQEGQLRVHMDAGLTLRGGSAGLAFCLDMLAAAHRAFRRRAPRSWLWGRFSRAMRRNALSWAATGAVTPAARIEPVVLEPKLRACLRESRIEHVLTPRQSGAGRRALKDISRALEVDGPRQVPGSAVALRPRLGFAAEKRRLRSHRSFHAAQAVLSIAGLRSLRQTAANIAAIAVTVVLLIALPDLRSILLPPPAPAVVAPSSPSPYHLWVSLDTGHPDRFLVVFESGFWSNRRSEVTRQKGTSPSVRAEIRLHRPARQTTDDMEDGTIWIERRRRFLWREFAPGERVGRYSLSYVSRLGRE